VTAINEVVARVEDALPNTGETHVGYVTEWHMEPSEGYLPVERLLTTNDLRALLAHLATAEAELADARRGMKYEADVAAQALAERDALRADAARLDWLEAQTRHVDGVDVCHEGELIYPGVTLKSEGYSVTRTSYGRRGDADTEWLADRLPTLRAALDAAMTTEAPHE